MWRRGEGPWLLDNDLELVQPLLKLMGQSIGLGLHVTDVQRVVEHVPAKAFGQIIDAI